MDSYQSRVRAFIDEVCQGDPTDLPERRDRFLEEAVELYQALGGTMSHASAVSAYVFGRRAGTPHREFGQAAMTLAALASEAGESLDGCAEDELARVSTPEGMARIREKRSARAGRGPLPGILPGEPALLGLATAEEIAADKTRIAGRFIHGHLNDCICAASAVSRMSHPPGAGTRLEPRGLVAAPRDGSLQLLVRIDPDRHDLSEAEWGWYEAGVSDQCWYGLDNEPIYPTHWIKTDPSDAPAETSP